MAVKKEPRRKTVTVYTPSHLKNPKLEPLVFKGVRRLGWYGWYNNEQTGLDLFVNPSHVVAVSITYEPEEA